MSTTSRGGDRTGRGGEGRHGVAATVDDYTEPGLPDHEVGCVTFANVPAGSPTPAGSPQ